MSICTRSRTRPMAPTTICAKPRGYLAVGVLNQHDHSLRSTWLFEGGYVLAMREGHPLAGKPITMEEFLEARHLLVSMSGDAHGFVDSYLDAEGAKPPDCRHRQSFLHRAAGASGDKPDCGGAGAHQSGLRFCERALDGRAAL